MGGNNFTIAILFVLCILVNCVTSDKEVNFDSAYGLTVRSISKVDDQLYDVIVSSNEVLNDQTIRILLPLDYTTSDRTRRYPALYLLHGSFGGAEDWTRAGNAQNICGNASLITVMPNGDPFGFYTNWVIPGNAAPQNWRTFHMEQLVPWIDFNLRTVTSKQGRAIAGLSMGGFGAIHYAEFYSHNFIYAASFSGALDLLNTNVQNGILNLRIIDDVPLVGPFGYPNAPASTNGWFAYDTITHAEELHDLSVALYTGDIGDLEHTLRDGSYRLQEKLTSLNVPVYLNDYGNGQSIGYECDGGHTWSCWKAALIDVLPRILANLQQEF
ncbi:unnamed protein product [Adineta ricciae]|uniref:Uncharacterized protein n=1 Tax=Adineta ricciae TaxID=249248 RepID=A0A813R2W7_ADIRI|nr:unnamed protein product [Adineta ricciae]